MSKIYRICGNLNSITFHGKWIIIKLYFPFYFKVSPFCFQAMKLVYSGCKEVEDVREQILRLRKEDLQVADYMESIRKLLLYLDQGMLKVTY